MPPEPYDHIRKPPQQTPQNTDWERGLYDVAHWLQKERPGAYSDLVMFICTKKKEWEAEAVREVLDISKRLRQDWQVGELVYVGNKNGKITYYRTDEYNNTYLEATLDDGIKVTLMNDHAGEDGQLLPTTEKWGFTERERLANRLTSLSQSETNPQNP